MRKKEEKKKRKKKKETERESEKDRAVERQITRKRKSRKVRCSFSCRKVAGQRRSRPEPLLYRTRLTTSVRWGRVNRWYRHAKEITTRRVGETKRERRGEERYEGLRGGGEGSLEHAPEHTDDEEREGRERDTREEREEAEERYARRQAWEEAVDIQRAEEEAADIENEEQLVFDHVTDTVQCVRSRRKPWELQTDIPAEESRFDNETTLVVQKPGTPKGLKLSRHFGIVQHTTKPASRACIGAGHRILRVGNVDVQQWKGDDRCNKRIVDLIESQQQPYDIVFRNPVPSSKWFKFGPGVRWARLFTDGGRRCPNADVGAASFGWAVVVGPFSNHCPHKISDKDGVCIARGGGYLGVGAHTNNTAEALGIAAGIEECIRMGIYNIDHLTDSNIMKNILNGKNQARQFRLYDTARAVERLKQVCVDEGGRVFHSHVTRNRNTVADAEANKAMDRCGPKPRVWNRTCDIDKFPTARTIKGWKPATPYELPEVSMPMVQGVDQDTNGQSEAPTVKMYQGYHTVMDAHTSEMLKWVRETIPDDDIAHWEGTTVLHIPENAKYAVVKAMMRVLNNLPSRPSGEEGDTFNFGQWKDGLYIAPRGSGAGGDGLRPDHITDLARYSEEFAESLYGFHSYLAHGPVGTGNCSQKFETRRDGDDWTRVLYLLPRWLLHRPKNKDDKSKKVSAKVVLGRVDSFMANEWKVLHKNAELAAETAQAIKPTTEKRRKKVYSEREKKKNKEELLERVRIRALQLIHISELGRGAQVLGNPQYVLTRRRCMIADETGELWDKVLEKARALHPQEVYQFDEYT